MTQSGLFIYPHPDRSFHTGTGNKGLLQSQSGILTFACIMFSTFTFRKVNNKYANQTAGRRHCCSDAMKPFFFYLSETHMSVFFLIDAILADKRDTPFKLS